MDRQDLPLLGVRDKVGDARRDVRLRTHLPAGSYAQWRVGSARGASGENNHSEGIHGILAAERAWRRNDRATARRSAPKSDTRRYESRGWVFPLGCWSGGVTGAVAEAAWISDTKSELSLRVSLTRRLLARCPARASGLFLCQVSSRSFAAAA